MTSKPPAPEDFPPSPATYFVISGTKQEWMQWRDGMAMVCRMEHRLRGGVGSTQLHVRMNHNQQNCVYQWLPVQSWRRIIEGKTNWGIVPIGGYLRAWEGQLDALIEAYELAWRTEAN